MTYAKFELRILARLVDGVVMWLIAMAILYSALHSTKDMELVIKSFGMAILAVVAYQVLTLAMGGATLGMRALGLRVVMEDGTPIGTWQAFIRTIFSIFPSSFFGLGYLTAFFSDKRQTWHDRFAGTVVVPVGSLRVEALAAKRPVPKPRAKAKPAVAKKPKTKRKALVLLLGVLAGGLRAHESEVSIKEDGDKRVIDSNGWPDHEPGQFPNAHNPNTPEEVKHHYEMPLHPEKASQVTRIGMSPFGVILNGVALDPSAAEWWQDDRQSGWQYEAKGGLNLGLDEHEAHVQPDGSYHYHGAPKGTSLKDAKDGHSPLLGYAADGFAIYGPHGYSEPKNPRSLVRDLTPSWRLKSGTRPDGPGGAYDGKFTQDWEYVEGSGDLDECGGIFSVTPESPEGVYHYVLTESFPYIPRCWSGTPDESFFRKPMRGGQGGPGGRRRPRPGQGGPERQEGERRGRRPPPPEDKR